jgi:intracellular sulfur oxidation DsrE/DsrF family protein
MKEAVLLITKPGMGQADEKLQTTLFVKYLELLLQNGSLPTAICFYTEGVKLVVTGSPVLAQLKALEAQGVRLVVCSTCLNYFNLTGQVQGDCRRHG